MRNHRRTRVGSSALLTVLALLATGCDIILVPRAHFDELPPPAAPDYASDEAWAALPDRADAADVAPEGERDGQATAIADVFFVHPTTYYSNDTWNQPLDRQIVNDRTDEGPIRTQASAFNAAARVFAPRYRQATLGAYTTDRVGEADAALALAYSDVRRAFEHYLEAENDGRAIIVAAHSQGAGHALRLLSELFSDLAEDPSLRDRLVAAYLVGTAVPIDALERTIPGIPLCATPTSTGCVAIWNTVAEGSAPARFLSVRVWYPEGAATVTDPTLLCVSPITWTAGDAPSEPSAHAGAVDFGASDAPPIVPGVVTARCDGRGLLGTTVSDAALRPVGDDYHIADYRLFYEDVRRNAVARVGAL